jgi:hypothetical protein
MFLNGRKLSSSSVNNCAKIIHFHILSLCSCNSKDSILQFMPIVICKNSFTLIFEGIEKKRSKIIHCVCIITETSSKRVACTCMCVMQCTTMWWRKVERKSIIIKKYKFRLEKRENKVGWGVEEELTRLQTCTKEKLIWQYIIPYYAYLPRVRIHIGGHHFYAYINSFSKGCVMNPHQIFSHESLARTHTHKSFASFVVSFD